MRYRRRWCNIAVVIGTVGLTACKWFGGGSGSGGTPAGGTTQASTAAVPPAPTFTASDTTQRPAILTYARGAQYATDSRVIDEQVLHRPGATGPRARVEATAYAHMLTDAQLARGALIGRFVSDGEFGALGIRRGVQYFFVDSVPEAGWRAIIVDDDSSRAPKVIRLVLTDTPHQFEVPSARWVEWNLFTLPNIPCGRYCCVPCDPVNGINCPDTGWPPRLDMEDMLRTRATPAAPLRGPGR